MNNYTDTQLKQALAKMLPEQLSWQEIDEDEIPRDELCWGHKAYHWPVLDTELLHLCWLVERGLNELWPVYYAQFVEFEGVTINATWQQRVIALVKVKGLEL